MAQPNVVKIDDYRAPQPRGPCEITFIGFPFVTPEGEEQKVTLTISVQNGDFEGIIDVIKENGGAWLPSTDGGQTFWFLPWPCAAVRVRPLFEGVGADHSPS